MLWSCPGALPETILLQKLQEPGGIEMASVIFSQAPIPMVELFGYHIKYRNIRKKVGFFVYVARYVAA
jgi:hypothetical protein